MGLTSRITGKLDDAVSGLADRVGGDAETLRVQLDDASHLITGGLVLLALAVAFGALAVAVGMGLRA